MKTIYEFEIEADFVSVNSMYGLSKVNKGGRHKFLTPKARKLKEDVKSQIREQLDSSWDCSTLESSLYIGYEFIFHTRHKRDIENYMKPITDCLVEMELIEDDNINVIHTMMVRGRINTKLDRSIVKIFIGQGEYDDREMNERA